MASVEALKYSGIGTVVRDYILIRKPGLTPEHLQYENKKHKSGNHSTSQLEREVTPQAAELLMPFNLRKTLRPNYLSMWLLSLSQRVTKEIIS